MKTKLLLLHGALGSTQQFSALEPLLQDQFELFTLNFSGHADHPTHEDYSMQLFADDVKAYLIKQGLESINIFGYSMGGYVALHLALQIPEKINKIITLGTKFDWSLEAAQKEIKLLNPEKIEEKIPQFANKLKETHHPQDWKLVMRKTADMMMEMGRGQRLEAKDFEQIQQEVAIGIGSKDRMVSIEESEGAARQLPSGRLVTLEGVPHPIDQIDPMKLAAYIQDAF